VKTRQKVKGDKGMKMDLTLNRHPNQTKDHVAKNKKEKRNKLTINLAQDMMWGTTEYFSVHWL